MTVPPEPKLDEAAAAFAAAGARFVVIGGAVIANRLVAGLRGIVGFKRLAGRPRDRNDLIGLEEIHGELPKDPLPGLDDRGTFSPGRMIPTDVLLDN